MVVTGDIAQKLRVLTAVAENLSSVSNIHMAAHIRL